MTTLTEIESAVADLSTEELRAVERMLHRLYQQRGLGLVYDDGMGVMTEEDLIAEGDAAFQAYDRAEEAHATAEAR